MVPDACEAGGRGVAAATTGPGAIGAEIEGGLGIGCTSCRHNSVNLFAAVLAVNSALRCTSCGALLSAATEAPELRTD
jgi:hypothetical protein